MLAGAGLEMVLLVQPVELKPGACTPSVPSAPDVASGRGRTAPAVLRCEPEAAQTLQPAGPTQLLAAGLGRNYLLTHPTELEDAIK